MVKLRFTAILRVIAALFAMGSALAACGSGDASAVEASQIAVNAFAAADLDLEDVQVAAEAVDGRWAMTATLDGDPLSMTVDADAGRVMAIDLGNRDPTRYAKQLETIALAGDRSDVWADARRFALAVLLVVALSVAVGLAMGRRSLSGRRALRGRRRRASAP